MNAFAYGSDQPLFTPFLFQLTCCAPLFLFCACRLIRLILFCLYRAWVIVVVSYRYVWADAASGHHNH